MNQFRKLFGRCRETWPILAAMFLLCILTACARENRPQAETDKTAADSADGKLTVVTTLFPYYDFARQVGGEAIDLSMVIPAGMDSHSFEPTPADIRLMQSADILICNGGAMEQWVEQVLDSLDTEHMTVVTMMDYVDTVEEEIVEGMEDADEEAHGHSHAHAGEDADHDHEAEADHEHESEAVHDHETETDHEHATETDHEHAAAADHDHEADHDHGSEHADDTDSDEIEYDEHIWTSPVNAMKLTEVIRDTLCAADPAHADTFQANAAAYLRELSALDGEFREIRAEAVHDIIIMGDKFPLRYFADAYDLRYRAAFSGCSTDTEPSAKTIAYLIDRIREEQISAVYYLELSSPRVAEIIGEETGAKPLLFHSCHNVTRREFDAGVTYLALMKQNAENLREGLCK